MDWNEYFFRHVYLAASKSKDDRTKIGAVLVRPDSKAIISEGFNGICRNVVDPADDLYKIPYSWTPIGEEARIPFLKRKEKPTKYFFYEHAERNSIYNCARHGISTLNATIFTQGIPCADCSRGIIQAGISKIIVHKQWPNLTHSPAWVESINYSKEMLFEAGVEIQWYDKVLGIKGYLDGKEIEV